MIRVALNKEEDILWAQHAADEAAKRGLKLVHQCHTQSLFETVEGIEHALRCINRPNFGLVYEPANLELCGQDYGFKSVRRLASWIFNVYLQNQVLQPDGKVTLNTWCRGSVAFELVPIHQSGGIDFPRVFDALAAINYRGPLTVHQAQIPGQSVESTARATADYLFVLARQCGLGG
jgi:sugar phosphate isomerase/epimerase